VKCLGDKLFIDEFFAYGDDNVLGLMLWNCGYKLVGIPEVVASHARGLTFGRKKVLSHATSLRETDLPYHRSLILGTNSYCCFTP